MSSFIGRTISHYKILEVLGGGGMGVVYRAEDTRLHRQIAMKFLLREYTQDPEWRKRFMREAQAVAKLDHPNICSVHDIGETDDDELYLCMGYYPGSTLKEMLTQGPLSVDETRRIALQIGEGLAHAHELDVIHRDVKPANILLDDHGRVRIIDFGLAKLRAGSTLTRKGMTIGTVAYMSPEQIRGQSIDHRTDIWSFAAVLYEALSGKVPFEAEYDQAILYQILHENPRLLGELRADIPQEIESAVHRGLQRNREDRQQTMHEFVDTIRGGTDNKATGVAWGKAARSVDAPTRVATLQDKTDVERRLVTIILVEVSGLSTLFERIDPEKASALVSECFRGLETTFSKYEGHTERIGGKGFMAVFGAPVAHENDPERSVRAMEDSLGFIEGFNRLNSSRLVVPLRLRAAVHQGRVLAGRAGGTDESNFSIVGDAVNVAAGLLENVLDGEVCMSAEVMRSVAGMVNVHAPREVRIKGRETTIQAFSFVSVKSRSESGGSPGVGTELVGRVVELRMARERVDGLLKQGGGWLALRGEAGVGKSRLKDEIVAEARARKVVVVEGRCSSFELNTPYYLWNTLLKNLLQLGPDPKEAESRDRLHETLQILALTPDEPYLATILSLRYEEILLEADQERKRRIYESMNRFLREFSLRVPTLFVLEDLHWLDRFSLELLEFFHSANTDPACLFLVTFRPEFKQGEQLFGDAVRLQLDRLSPEDSVLLMQHRLKAKSIPERLSDLIHERAEGNPFFIEELIKTLLEKGLIKMSREAVQVLSDALEAEIPQGIHSIIMARIDRLEQRIREVLLSAAVIGREFSKNLLSKVIQPDAPLESGLKELQELELILEKDEAREMAYIFKHYLIQEVAYDTLLVEKRKKLHGMIAQAIETLYADRLKDFYEVLAFHFERSEQWDKAAEYLSRAGRKLREIYTVDESSDFDKRRDVALEKIYESASARRLGWKMLQGVTALVAMPLGVVMTAMPVVLIYLVWKVPEYIIFDLWGSPLLGALGFYAYVGMFLVLYPWTGLVLLFFGVVPFIKGNPGSFDLMEDRLIVTSRVGKTAVIHFHEITDIRYFDPERKSARAFRQKMMDPFFRIEDYGGLTIARWTHEVLLNILPPYSFGFGSSRGEIILTKNNGFHLLRQAFPFLNTPEGSRSISLSPTDPREFYKQLQVALSRWRIQQRISLMANTKT